MAKFDVAATFASYNLASLEEVAADLNKMIAAKQEEERNTLLAKLAEIAGKKGFKLEDLLPQPVRKRAIVAPKYRDPATKATWTGRGRTPPWMPASKDKWDSMRIPESEAAAVAAVLQ